MSEWLLSREAVIAIAVLGGVLALLASFVEARRGSGPMAKALMWSGYGCMGISMTLFVAIGLTSEW